MDDNTEKKESDVYYDFGEAWSEVKSEFRCGSNKDRAAATAKLVGKTLFNTSIYTGKLGFRVIKELPASLEKSQIEREETQKKYQGKSDSELLKILKSDGFFGASLDEKLAAKLVLKSRSGREAESAG